MILRFADGREYAITMATAQRGILFFELADETTLTDALAALDNVDGDIVVEREGRELIRYSGFTAPAGVTLNIQTGLVTAMLAKGEMAHG